jgi:hypothetical protein
MRFAGAIEGLNRLQFLGGEEVRSITSIAIAATLGVVHLVVFPMTTMHTGKSAPLIRIAGKSAYPPPFTPFESLVYASPDSSYTTCITLFHHGSRLFQFTCFSIFALPYVCFIASRRHHSIHGHVAGGAYPNFCPEATRAEPSVAAPSTTSASEPVR